ncbi:MAG: phosphate regulon transcriptional regulatory protein PhoB [Gammaproteobacteria bacterium]|nr:MAG: phosphate regulon transcriptional regulatory protein PhoB [Gammaproteobacteria bacterium]
MNDIRILIVEDEAAIREMVGFALEGAGMQWVGAASADQVPSLLKQEQPDLLLLDWMLPGIGGLELLRRLRRDPATRHLPVIMLTARGDEHARVQGLESGADDYVTKPFSTRELIARIRAVLRRHGAGGDGELVEAGRLRLNTATHRVTIDEQAVELSPTEFRLLNFFVTHPERVFTRGQLLDQIWGDNVYIEERTVDVHIRRLRKALQPHGYDRAIQTVRTVGYRFSLPEGD